MRIKDYWFIAVAFVGSLNLHASGDLEINMPKAERMFTGNRVDEVRFLPSAQARINLHRYLWGDDFHKWAAGVKGDLAFVSFGENVLWNMSLSMQTLADQKNEMNFRLVQLYYDIVTSVQWRIRPVVLSLGYRHRCSHGADRAQEFRILIRSGPELAVSSTFDLGPVETTARIFGHVTTVGQNQDKTFQPRALFGGAAQANLHVAGPMGVIAAGGLGVAIVGNGSNDVFLITSPLGTSKSVLLPSGSAGITLTSEAIHSRFLIAYERALDSGITMQANSPSTLALRIDFQW